MPLIIIIIIIIIIILSPRFFPLPSLYGL